MLNEVSQVESVIFCRPTKTQAVFYEKLLQGIDLNCVLDNSCVLSSITQLRKVCNHPSTLDAFDQSAIPAAVGEAESTFEAQGSKLAVVSSLLHNLKSGGSGEKVVLVSISTKVLDLLADLCDHYG